MCDPGALKLGEHGSFVSMVYMGPKKGGNSLYNFLFMSYMDTKLPPGDFYSVKERIRERSY